MVSDRLKMPPARDFGFYQRRKHDKWREVPAPTPALEAPLADSHAHLHMLPDPAWELARCAANGVDFICMIADPSEDGPRPFDELQSWQNQAQQQVPHAATRVVIATGVHPHNAQSYSQEIEQLLLQRLRDPRVVALGEVGLDYYYDISPREQQRQVFRRQAQLAQQLDMPLVLHLRDAQETSEDGKAHEQAFSILQELNFPAERTLLHCCTLPADDVRPWVEAGCYIAYGGALTFKNAHEVRAGLQLVPRNRLLLETDAPFMTPEPMRGAVCTPAHVIFTAAFVCEQLGCAPGEERQALLRQLYDNTLAFYGCTSKGE